MRASTIAKGYTFYLGTGPTMTVMVQPDGATGKFPFLKHSRSALSKLTQIQRLVRTSSLRSSMSLAWVIPPRLPTRLSLVSFSLVSPLEAHFPNALIFPVLTSEVCALVTTQMCSAIEVTQTLSASQPMITETAGTTTSILESASSSSTKKTSTSSEIKETSTSVSMTSTGTQTVATPTASSEASQTEIMVFCAIAGAIIMYFL